MDEETKPKMDTDSGASEAPTRGPIKLKCKCYEDDVRVVVSEDDTNYALRGGEVSFREGDKVPPYIGQTLVEAGCIVSIGERGPRAKQGIFGNIVVECDWMWVESGFDHLMEAAAAFCDIHCPSAFYVTLESIPGTKEDEKDEGEGDKPKRSKGDPYDEWFFEEFSPGPVFVQNTRKNETEVMFDYESESVTCRLDGDCGSVQTTFYVGEYLPPGVAQMLAEEGCRITLLADKEYEWKYDDEMGLMVKIGGSWEDDKSESFFDVVAACESPPNPTECFLMLSELPEPDEDEEEEEVEEEHGETQDIAPCLLGKVIIRDGKVEVYYRGERPERSEKEVYEEGDDIPMILAQSLGELGFTIEFATRHNSALLRRSNGYWHIHRGSQWDKTSDRTLIALSMFYHAFFVDHSWRLAKVPEVNKNCRIYQTNSGKVDIEWRNPL